MSEVLPRETGLDARFEAELAAEQKDGEVRHDRTAGRFEIGECGAVAEYRLEGGRMVFTHTFVPPELRGRKLAERLVTAALEFARKEGLHVVPQCSYVDVFLRRHAEFGNLRAD